MYCKQAFKTYASECQSRRIPLCNWRRLTNVSEVKCPSNSRYLGCAVACPNTCQFPFSASRYLNTKLF